MKQLLLMILALIILLISLLDWGCQSCKGDGNEFQLLNDPSEIVSIEIAQGVLSPSDAASWEEVECVNTEIIAVIEDHETFMSEFQEVDGHWLLPISSPVFFSPTRQPYIIITYQNGEYQEISAWGCAKFIELDGEFRYIDYDFYVFDDEEFTAFIEEYR